MVKKDLKAFLAVEVEKLIFPPTANDQGGRKKETELGVEACIPWRRRNVFSIENLSHIN